MTKPATQTRKLSDLVSKGVVANYRAIGPADVVNRPILISMGTLELTETTANDGTVRRGFKCEITIVETGEKKRLMSQSLALLQQVEEQFLPFAEEIGESLEVTIAQEVSKKNAQRVVYHFE